MKEKIYFIPGLMCDKRLWERLSPYLEDDYILVHLEIPITSNFDEIISILDKEFKEDTINLFGFSFGAYIASYYTVKHPHRVKRLFLNSGTPSLMTQEEIDKRNKMIELMNSFGFKGISSIKVASLLEAPNHTDQNLITLIKKMYSDLGKEVYISQIKTINTRIPLEEKLINLDLPIKFFYSTNDRLLNYDSLKKFTLQHKHIIKTSRVGTSHMIPLEIPKLLSDEIRLWMNDA
ncbi:alpha/beta hydrolase [Arcobacteraceae bacterium]|nr:alpha/beta hydrolase [Arcobacteraceae bacterium]